MGCILALVRAAKKGEMFLPIRLAAALLAMFISSAASAQEEMVGRRFEILDLDVHGCPQPKRATCTLVRRGEFLITGIVDGKRGSSLQSKSPIRKKATFL